MVSSGPRLLLRTVAGSVALLQPRSVLMSEGPVIFEGHTEVWGCVGVQGPHYCWGR
ncbi:hypothetical protein I79_002079 [Cricetulus griseus]|uniref:Uncharacterized protein n=1 Tax=Cricetulus griseus TaxID=10029 RepID=G3GWF7_CRIGR|nr:hypothetical protein I79_002079 [Cricetulus griseus]